MGKKWPSDMAEKRRAKRSERERALAEAHAERLANDTGERCPKCEGRIHDGVHESEFSPCVLADDGAQSTEGE